MKKLNYEFCDDPDAPEVCFINNRIWWNNNQHDILAWLGEEVTIIQRQSLRIPNPADRTYFMLRWPQYEL
jgi:hypothetical protein